MEFELLLAVLLVTAVIYLFLHSLPATFIASVAAPISLVGTFAVMHLLGFSLNNLTLMALTISTGFVVDDAIVMIENISRYIEEGEKPLEAALRGAGEIGFTIISLTVSLIAVLIPLLFMGDVVGRLFREFAITLAVTIVISAIVSLTLVPTLSALWLKTHDHAQETRLARWTQTRFDRLIERYDDGLKWVLAHQATTLIVATLTVILTAVLYIVIPKGLFPTQDTGIVQAYTMAGQSVSYSRMAALQQQMAKAILADPDVVNLTSYIGVDGQNTTMNVGRMLINLKPQGQRTGVPGQGARRPARARPRRGRHDPPGAAGAGPDHRFPTSARPSTSSPCRASTRPRSTSGRPSWWPSWARTSACATSRPTPRTRACRPWCRSTATAPRAWAWPPRP